MLQTSCPDCLIPLIQDKKGRVFCANCEKDAVYVKSDREATQIQSAVSSRATTATIISDLNSVLLGKLTAFTTQIASLSDIQELDKWLSMVDRVLETLMMLKEYSEPSGGSNR